MAQRFGTLGTKNVLILFFSALCISLLLLLLLFSFFFRDLNLAVKTKELKSAPTLEDDADLYNYDASDSDSGLNTASGWDRDALIRRLNINVPGEAERLQKLVDSQSQKESPPKSDEAANEKEEDLEAGDYFVGYGETEEAPASPPPQGQNTPASEAPPPVSPPAPQASALHRVYLGGFYQRADAEAAQAHLQSLGYSPILQQTGRGYELQLGVFQNRQQADALALQAGASVEVKQ